MLDRRMTLVARIAVLVGSGLLLQRCTAQPAASPATTDSGLTPIVSVKELMENVIDPTADYVFDAVAVDISDKGTVETRPTTDDDWLKIERGALLLAESTNLLKMRRPMAPADDLNAPSTRGAPELHPAEIQAKVDKDRALWNKFADGLRDEALKSLTIAKARNSDALFQAGSDIDKACENCHLEYWYPGDREAVLKDQNSRATITPPKK
jgi:hypothetical protein